jgi:hypothetical protein
MSFRGDYFMSANNFRLSLPLDGIPAALSLSGFQKPVLTLSTFLRGAGYLRPKTGCCIKSKEISYTFTRIF